MKAFAATLAKILMDSKNEITPSPADNSLYDTGLDKFDAGKKIYDDAIKSTLASSEKMPKGEIKSLVKSD